MRRLLSHPTLHTTWKGRPSSQRGTFFLQLTLSRAILFIAATLLNNNRMHSRNTHCSQTSLLCEYPLGLTGTGWFVSNGKMHSERLLVQLRDASERWQLSHPPPGNCPWWFEHRERKQIYILVFCGSLSIFLDGPNFALSLSSSTTNSSFLISIKG